MYWHTWFWLKTVLPEFWSTLLHTEQYRRIVISRANNVKIVGLEKFEFLTLQKNRFKMDAITGMIPGMGGDEESPEEKERQRKAAIM